MAIGRGFRRLFRIGSVADRIDDELDEELGFHMDETVEELVGRGMSRSEALTEAGRRFGSERRHRAAIHALERRHRAAERAAAPLTALRDDLVSGAKRIARAPGFALAVILTLALGIGVNATMFTVVDRLLLSPPSHVEDADAVKRLYVRRESFTGERFTSWVLTYPDYRDLLDAGGLEAVGAYHGPRDRTLGSGEGARRIRAVHASASLFTVLGVRPRLGRFFTAEEDAPGAPGTVVLSESLWRSAFGGDPEVLGRELRIGAGRYVVVGVAPRGFTGADLEPVDAWLPLEPSIEAEQGDEFREARGWWMFNVIGRLAPGTAPAAAESEATALHRAARADIASYDPEAEILTSSLVAGDRAGQQDDAIAVSRWLAGVSLLVLLIACANVANLLLARAIRTRRELAVRVALGVSRRRLLQQQLVESLLLAATAGGVALAVTWGGAGLLGSVLLPDVLFEPVGGSRVLAFTFLAVLLTALLAGGLPALLAARSEVAPTLKEGARTVTLGGSSLRKGLLVAQAALSVLLLVGAGLFLRSLHELGSRDPGFDYRQAVVLQLEPETSDWRTEERVSAYRLAAEGVSRLPPVEAVGTTAVTPLRMSMSTDVALPGRDSLPFDPQGGPYVFGVDPGYFPAMGLDVLRGRGIEPGDQLEGAPHVAVVTETMAQELWPGEDALGQCMYVGQDDEEGPPECTTVVGVVEDHPRYDISAEDPERLYYTPLGRQPFADGAQNMVVRVAGDPASAVPGLRGAIRSGVPGIRFVDSWTLRSEVEDDLASWRLGATLFTLFGLLALVVAAIGLYGVLSFEVAQRRHELGIRSALGATSGRLVRLVAREALGVSVLGIGLGLFAAAALSPRISDLLFRVSPTDPLVYAAVAAALAVTAAVATIPPALRATRADPREALDGG